MDAVDVIVACMMVHLIARHITVGGDSIQQQQLYSNTVCRVDLAMDR